MTAIRTRFAPSPTGYMHIGGMRTALFNWLFARHHGGTFVLRIDDTDRQRNVDAALVPILDAFRWLKLDWDEGPEVGGDLGPYFQSQRDELYQAAAERLLAEGKAYRCFETPEEIQAARAAAEADGVSYVGRRSSLDLDDSTVEAYLAEGRPHVVRFVVPRDEQVVIEDAVRGRVEWDAALIPDPVIQRGDGSPLYNFATVVDDAAMQISHVIRAEEHLSNTPVQALLHQSLGHDLPVFAHVPYVAAPGTQEKLSKRKLDKYRNNPQFRRLFEAADRILPRIGRDGDDRPDPVMVEYYDVMGYRPEAVFNALARLGWSLDDKTEVMSRETIVASFTLDRVVKSPAGLDTDKLASLQGHWIGESCPDERLDRCLGYLHAAGLITDISDEGTRTFVASLLEAMGDRLKIYSDVLEFDEFFTSDEELEYDQKAVSKRLAKEGVAENLAAFRDELAATDAFDAASLESLMKGWVERQDMKLGQIIHPVRVAVTGKPAGIGMFECLELLGRDRVLARIDRALPLCDQEGGS